MISLHAKSSKKLNVCKYPLVDREVCVKDEGEEIIEVAGRKASSKSHIASLNCNYERELDVKI